MPSTRSLLPPIPTCASARRVNNSSTCSISSKGPSRNAGCNAANPNCACHCDASRRHGPYFEWTYKVKGKTVNVKLSPQAAPLYQAATQQHRQLKAALAKVERLARTAFSHPGQEG